MLTALQRTQWIITCHEHVTRATWPGPAPRPHTLTRICCKTYNCWLSWRSWIWFFLCSKCWLGHLETASQAINNVAKPCFDQLDLYQMTFYIFRHDQKFKYLKLKLNTELLSLWQSFRSLIYDNDNPSLCFYIIILRQEYWVDILLFSVRRNFCKASLTMNGAYKESWLMGQGTSLFKC